MMKIFIFCLVVTFVFTLSAKDLTPLEQLGKQIYFEKISSPDWMACATCHAPDVGFVGPNPAVNEKSAVYNGAVPERFGNRKPPSASYATESPIFNYDPDEGLFFGGNFWDGRATGWTLNNPSAEQAIGPFLNHVEHNMPSKESVLMEIEKAKMGDLWEQVWREPLSYAPDVVNINYNRVGLAIAAFEASVAVNPFSSKYDFYLKGEATLTDLELKGLALFEAEDKGNCAACHPSQPDDEGNPPLFTDCTYDNLGVPPFEGNPFYLMDKVYLDDGSPINPVGIDWVDNGLGEFLEALVKDEAWRALDYVPAEILELNKTDIEEMIPENYGKHKVPSLRNVGKRPSKNFVKAYGHNGFFKSLEEITHFYNTRDVEVWPAPEVAATVNTDELGNLGLTTDEELAIVAFMNTLSDGYDAKKDKVKDKSVLASTDVELNMTSANPFNPTASLGYSLSKNSNVIIEVYNVIGQRVAVLVNEAKPAGTYTVRWDASRMPSGTYFARLQAESMVVTQKLLLVK
jgi:cytochrome c peroxidase